MNAIVATAQTTIDGASSWRRHAIGCLATGAWSVVPEWSPDGGTTWIAATPPLALGGANPLSDTIYIDQPYPMLRVNATRTDGALTVWVMQDDDSPRPS